MIKVKVKTLWQGKVGIRDRYVVQCQDQEEDLMICHGEGAMLIPWGKLDRRTHGVSKEVHKDRFGRGGHRLIYFLWQPTAQQAQLKLGVVAVE